MGGESFFQENRIAFRGTLDLLLLKTLKLEPMHGYGTAQRLRQISKDVLQVEEGSLYPALGRLLAKGWVVDEWKKTENKSSQVLPPYCKRAQAA